MLKTKPEVISLRGRVLQSRDAIEDLTAKVFTQTLRGLERDGLIRRRVFPVASAHVGYRLTDMGRAALP